MGQIIEIIIFSIYMITYLFIDEGNFINIIIEYVKSVNIYIKGSLVTEKKRRDELLNNFNDDSNYIFFGIKYTNYPKINRNNVYFVNLEPLTCDGKYSNFNFLQEVINFNKKFTNINLLDYSRGNINILNKYNIKSEYLPYYINNEEIKNFDKEYDLCTCCSWNKRISEIYTPLSQIYKSCSIGNPAKWGDERDDILFRSKVLINLHHREKDYNILQELRITRCILNKIIVISEHAIDDYLYPLNAYVIFCDYGNIVDKTKEVLSNYNEYYDKIYKNMDYEEVKKKYEKHLIKL
tara:strand:+ start:4854 stop:5735 length:882 start_codon:yes stop_codon:yes gene_type:complete